MEQETAEDFLSKIDQVTSLVQGVMRGDQSSIKAADALLERVRGG